MDGNEVKIVFKFFSEILDEWTVETMWAETINSQKGLYKIDNIPFYAPVSCDDIVFAENDYELGSLMYRKTVEHSGNSTIQVVVLNKTIETNELRDLFNSMGCESEKYNEGYFVMEVPKKLDYQPIRKILMELEANGKIGYAEPNLGATHRY